jgi:hypothetical protein
MSSHAATSLALLPADPLEPANTTFHPFRRLPLEIRLNIWGIASRVNYPRRIFTRYDFRPLSAPPSVLHACVEARSEGLKTFKLLSFECDSTESKPRKNSPYYIDPVKDVFCYIDPLCIRSETPPVWLNCLIEAKVEQLVVNEIVLWFFNSFNEELSTRKLLDMESFGTLLTGSIKTLILVRYLNEDQFQEVNLEILGENWENWETEGEWVPESEFPRFEEVKEKRKVGLEWKFVVWATRKGRLERGRLLDRAGSHSIVRKWESVIESGPASR